MKKLFSTLFVFTLVGCISGPPHLNPEQLAKAEKLPVFEKYMQVNRSYIVIDKISASDCNSIPGYSGEVTVAIFNLKKKAVHLGADAIVEMKCAVSPLVNDCWAPETCSGTAVVWK